MKETRKVFYVAPNGTKLCIIFFALLCSAFVNFTVVEFG
jgi:hypothetical protein